MTERATLADRLERKCPWKFGGKVPCRNKDGDCTVCEAAAALRTEPAAATATLVAQWDAAVMDSAASPEIVEAGNRLARALICAAAPREPDGWIVILDSLLRQVVLDKETADEARAQGYRVRPFYFDAPAAAPVPDAELLDSIELAKDLDAYVEALIGDGEDGHTIDVAAAQVAKVDTEMLLSGLERIAGRLPAATERTQEGNDAD